MGAWGPGLFEDDVAADVQAMWEDARGRGDSSESATATVLRDLGREMVDDEDDGPVVWIALAALQVDSGELVPEVRHRALMAIAPNIERWAGDAAPAVAAAREQVLAALRDRLNQAT
jgi:hypothetical protein